MNEDKLRNYTNTTYDGIITIYSHDIKPNWLRFDTQSLWDHPTSAKLQVAKTRVGVSGVGPVSTKAPTGRGQILARARICPPALEVDLSPAWTRRWSFPRITNVNHTWLPCNNITRILLAFFFFFWPFLPENSLTWWQKYFIFCLIVSYLSLTSDQHLPLRQGCGLQWQLFLIFYLWLSWFVCFLI